MSSKKRKCLSLSEKVAVIQFAKANPNFGARKIAQNFEIGRTQFQTILQKKESLLTSFETLDDPKTNIKRFRTGKFDAVNKALREWYNCCKSSNIPVSGPMLEITGFADSNGWLESFKRQHNIFCTTVAGEKGGVNPNTVESWKEQAREITRGWNPSDVWNVDETGSFWRGLPAKSLNEKGKKCTSGKQSKQRNT